jgi:hypothetical protein
VRVGRARQPAARGPLVRPRPVSQRLRVLTEPLGRQCTINEVGQGGEQAVSQQRVGQFAQPRLEHACHHINVGPLIRVQNVGPAPSPVLCRWCAWFAHMDAKGRLTGQRRNASADARHRGAYPTRGRCPRCPGLAAGGGRVRSALCSTTCRPRTALLDRLHAHDSNGRHGRILRGQRHQRHAKHVVWPNDVSGAAKRPAAPRPSARRTANFLHMPRGGRGRAEPGRRRRGQRIFERAL